MPMARRPDPLERIDRPISTGELERRWSAVRAAMVEHEIDVLLMQSNNDYMGGYVKYFTDIPSSHGYSTIVVFPADDLMTLVIQGPFGGARNLEGRDPTRRGVKRVLTTPSYSSISYARDYDAELAATALAPFAGGTIGVVSPYQVSFALVDFVQRNVITSGRVIDAGDLVDQIRASKSPEELACIRETAQLQDDAMRAAFSQLRDGMRDRDLTAIAQQVAHSLGSEQGLYRCASSPPGQASEHLQRHFQNRTIRAGDSVALLIECNGAGGHYTELGRTAVLGKASDEMHAELAFTLSARDLTRDLLVQGADCATIAAEYNAYMKQNGRPEETRLHSHGMGYDMVERPLIRKDETMTVCANSNIVIHPSYVHGGVFSWICDNFWITAEAPPERLHAFPEVITELG
jgi:Xaa-Pro aminopeptidase